MPFVPSDSLHSIVEVRHAKMWFLWSWIPMCTLFSTQATPKSSQTPQINPSHGGLWIYSTSVLIQTWELCSWGWGILGVRLFFPSSPIYMTPSDLKTSSMGTANACGVQHITNSSCARILLLQSESGKDVGWAAVPLRNPALNSVSGWDGLAHSWPALSGRMTKKAGSCIYCREIFVKPLHM